jgi:hypothetical protein
MSFILSQVKGPSRSRVELDKAAGTAITELTVIAKAAGGLVEAATSSTARSEVKGVATESVAALDASTKVGVNEVFENDTYIATTTNNSNAAHTNQRMVLTDAGTVNNTGTDNANGIVEQLGVVGNAADKKIIVKFV